MLWGAGCFPGGRAGGRVCDGGQISCAPFPTCCLPPAGLLSKFSKASSRRKGLVQGRGSQAKRRVVKILSDRHVRCRQKSACRVIQPTSCLVQRHKTFCCWRDSLVPKAVRGQRAVRAPAVCAPVVRDGSDDDGCRRATDNLRDGFSFRLARGAVPAIQSVPVKS